MSSGTSKPPDFDSQWALPFEIVAVVFEEVLERYHSDHSELAIARNPYTIMPLLCTSKNLQAHLLPLLYRNITFHTHHQLLYFLQQADVKNVKLIRKVILRVDRRLTPVLPEEQFVLHREAYGECEAGLNDMKGRMALLEPSGRDNESAELVVHFTSIESFLFAGGIGFPYLPLIFGSHVYSGGLAQILTGSGTRPICRLRLDYPIGWLTVVSTDICTSLTSMSNPVDYLELGVCPPVFGVDYALLAGQAAADDNREYHFVLATGKVSNLVVTMREKAEEEERHVFCEGQPRYGYRLQDERVTYPTCAAGKCPFREAEEGEAEEQ